MGVVGAERRECRRGKVRSAAVVNLALGSARQPASASSLEQTVVRRAAQMTLTAVMLTGRRV
jgi:hypothetical protein